MSLDPSIVPDTQPKQTASPASLLARDDDAPAVDETAEVAAPAPLEFDAETTTIKIYLEEDLFSPDVVDRLRVIADHNRLTHPLVGLPDIHYKTGNFIPTGTAVATDPDRIVPAAIGNGTGCGFCAVKLDKRRDDLAPNELHEMFTRFMERIPIHESDETLTPAEIDRALAEGVDSVEDLSEDERACIDFHGNMFRDKDLQEELDFASYFPKENYTKAARDLGRLAAGNHFVELVEVATIFDVEVAEWFGVREGDLMLTMHADGNHVSNIGKTFTPYKTFRNWARIKQELSKVAFHMRFYKHPFFYGKQDELFTLPTDSKAGRRFVSFAKASANFGFMNRLKLREKLSRALEEQSIGSKLFLDSVHDTLSFEEDLWVHRTGASVARPAAQQTTPLYQRYGKPLLLPCALGLNSFLMVPGSGVQHTYGSVNHGTGRIVDRTQASGFTREDIDRSMDERDVALYSKGTFNITREHNSTFKNPERVRSVVEGLDLARVFAELKPLAVMKG